MRRILAVAVFALGVAMALSRVGLSLVPGAAEVGAGWAMNDFFSSMYYPVRALLEGGNPHDRHWFLATYPVSDMYGPFLPINLLIHLPFGLLPPYAAGVAYFVFLIGLALLMAWLCLRLAGATVTTPNVVLVAGLILVSRPGHWSLLLGQPAILLTCAVYLAIMHVGRAPIWSGLALAVAVYKPTFGVPLALLMIAGGHLRPVVAAVVVSLVVNAPLFGILLARAGGLRGFIDSLLGAYSEWQALPTIAPAANHRLVDADALISRILGSSLEGPAQVLLGLGLLAIAAVAIRRLDWTRSPGRDLATAIVATAILVSGHHLGYDMVLLAAPLVSLVVRGLPDGAPNGLRWVFLALYAIPAMNWLATDAFLARWAPTEAVWLVVASVNAACVALLFFGYVGLALAYKKRSTAPSISPALPNLA